MAGFMWVLYMAIEPYMRRRWPEMLISWTRVLTGKFYDARVGRDVMLGALGGAVMAIIQNSVNALPAWLHVANIQPSRTSQLTLRGSAGLISALSYDANLAVQWALATGAFLVVARFIMRRDWPAVVLSGISLGLVVLAADNLLIAVPAVLLCADCLQPAVPFRALVGRGDTVLLFHPSAIPADLRFLAVVRVAINMFALGPGCYSHLRVAGDECRAPYFC